MQPTSAFVLPTLVRLQKALEVQPDDHNAIKKMKTEMSKNLLKRSNPQEKQICLISSLLHPKTKELAFVDSGDKEQAIKLAKEEMMEYIRNPPPSSTVIKTEADTESDLSAPGAPPTLPELPPTSSSEILCFPWFLKACLRI